MRVSVLTRFGGHASVVCVPQEQAYAMPENMTFEEGAALPVNYLTAYHILFEIRRLRPDDQGCAANMSLPTGKNEPVRCVFP